MCILFYWECFVIYLLLPFFFINMVLFIICSSLQFPWLPLLFPCSLKFFDCISTDPSLLLSPPILPFSQLRTCGSFPFCFLCTFGHSPPRQEFPLLIPDNRVKKTQNWIAPPALKALSARDEGK